MQVKQIENILRAKSGVPQNQVCLVIPLSYHDSDSDNLQNVSSNSKFGDFIPIFLLDSGTSRGAAALESLH